MNEIYLIFIIIIVILGYIYDWRRKRIIKKNNEVIL